MSVLLGVGLMVALAPTPMRLEVETLAPASQADPHTELARKQLVIAKRAYEGSMQLLLAPPSVGDVGVSASLRVDRLARWSRRWMKAEIALESGKAATLKARRDHVGRMERLLEMLREFSKSESSGVDQTDVDTIDYELQEARSLLLKAEGK